MKKMLMVAIAIALVFTTAISGCSSNKDANETTDSSQSVQDDAETEEKAQREAEEQARLKAEEEQKQAEEANKSPHITYSDVSFTAIRDFNDTIYVVVKLKANCEELSGFDDQVIIQCKVNDREPYDMRPLPTEWEVGGKNEGRSYSNELLQCCTRFDANPGDTVSFWIDNPKSGATYEGLDGLADQLTSSTTDAINTPPTVSSPSSNGDDRVCYVTPTGYAYHSHTGCPRLSRSTEIYEMTVGDAKDDGYEPCDFCN